MATSPLGFDPRGVLTVGVQLPGAAYRRSDAQLRFFTQLEERLRGLPGVVSVADASGLPTAVQQHNGIFVIGAPPAPDGKIPFVLVSGIADLGRLARALGVPYYLGKPYAVNQLLGLIERVLAERAR